MCIRDRARIRVIGGEIGVARLSMEKYYDKTRLRIGQKEEIKATVDIENTGSAPINSLNIEDELPAGFKINKITVTFQSSDKDFDLIKQGAQVRERDRHIYLKISNLTEMVGRDMMPGDRIRVSYVMVSDKTQPGIYQPRIRGTANTDPRGEDIEIEITGDMPILRASKGVVNVFVSKDILSTEREDELKIQLYVRNSGKETLRNIILQDIVPTGFTIISDQRNFTVGEEKADGSSVVEWQITALSPGQEMEITYSLIGSGEYNARDVVAMVRG